MTGVFVNLYGDYIALVDGDLIAVCSNRADAEQELADYLAGE